MVFGRITHTAINVPNIRKAEELYHSLFGLRVKFREAKIDGEWRTAPPDADWNEINASGIEIDLSFLYRDEFEVALSASTESNCMDQVYHIGLQCSSQELQEIRSNAEESGCELLIERDSVLLLEDPYGYEWEVTPEWNPSSTGERTGQWMDLGRE